MVRGAALLVAALHCGACATGDAARPGAGAGAAVPAATDDAFIDSDLTAPKEKSELGAAVEGQAKEPGPADDGWPDLSEFLSKKFGFLPIVVPITEPALGYGAAGGMAFLSAPLGQKDGYGRPNITFVGGFGTENDSKGVVLGDLRYWFDDKVQTLAGVIDSSVNLDFYGVGRDRPFEPVRVNLEPQGGMLQAKTRLADSPVWAGLGYSYASTRISIDDSERTLGVQDFERTSRVGGLSPSLTWDTRDNIFTPSRGTYVEANVGVYAPAFGSDRTFQRVLLMAMHYEPLAKEWFLGVRGRAQSVFGDEPFYLDPYVGLRGVPVMRYQGETAADGEAEVRWQFWKRLSLVGFGGVGGTWSDGETQSVVSGGFGIRYELAREYGIHFGLDVAFSDGDAAIYLQIGSAWARP